MFNNFFFFSKNCTIYEIIWNNIVESDRPYMTVQPMWIACWTSKAMGTHLDLEILNCFSVVKLVTFTCLNTYIVCLVVSNNE